MIQNVGENVYRRKIGGQKEDLSFGIGFRKIVQVYVSRGL
jgi:hypothetical protein